MTTAKPLYTVGSSLKLPFSQRRWDVTAIEQRESGVWYRFNLLQAPFVALKWYSENELRAANQLPYPVTVLPDSKWSNLLYHPYMTQQTAYHETTKQPRQMIVNVVSLFTDNTPSPAEAARIDAEYLETPLTPLVINGRARKIFGVVNLAGLGYARNSSLDTLQEQAAKGAEMTYALAAVTDGDLHTMLLSAAWMLEYTAYSPTKDTAVKRWKAAMWELGAVQLTVEALAREYLQKRKDAA